MTKIFACCKDVNRYTTGILNVFRNPYKIPDELESHRIMRKLADKAQEELNDRSIKENPVKYGGVFSKWLYNYSLNLPPLDGLPKGRGVLAHHLISGEKGYDDDCIIIPTWEAACAFGGNNILEVLSSEELDRIKDLGGKPTLRRRRTEVGLMSCVYVRSLLLLAGRPYKNIKGCYKDGLLRKAMTNQEAAKLMFCRGLVYHT